MTIRRWNVSDEREHMDRDEEGRWISSEDYDELLALLKEAEDVLKTSIPLRGDHRHSQVLIKIESTLRENNG